jgi:hypothetical protein
MIVNKYHRIQQLAADFKKHSQYGDKYTGSRGERETAKWIADRLTNAGFSIKRQRLDWPFFSKRASSLAIGSSVIEVIPQVVVVPTSSDGVNAKLAIVHNKLYVEETLGCIALIVAPYRRHASLAQPPVGPLVKASADAGAKAIIIITSGPSGEAVALNTSGKMPFVPIPTATMSPKAIDLVSVHPIIEIFKGFIYYTNGDRKIIQ